MKIRNYRLWSICLLVSFLLGSNGFTKNTEQFWVKVKATDKFQRSVIANIGAAIETTTEDYVIVYATKAEKEALENLGWVETSFPYIGALDFPKEDQAFHNYFELQTALESLNNLNPQISKIIQVGKTVEGRDMLGIVISGQLEKASELPAVIFMGGHHAREHLSVEVPLGLARYLIESYQKGNEKIKSLVDSRVIHIIPAVNPDGLEYDVENGRYKLWRKNRKELTKNNFGVDLNRNYGFKWGTGGSSSSESSDTYMGPQPFSEPETQAIKNYITQNTNITILLSFHSFSELILYPWGHSYDPISQLKDRQVHEVMAKKMSTWNGYTPQQASQLYIASGDTTDWSYGEHRIISFTFELDPKNTGFGGGGFYPGAKVIPDVIRKNIEPALYLIEHADNPYRVLD
jgi:carboxypeptidase T